MLIDSYETPGAENLLLLGRERHSDGAPARRLLITEAGAAALFVAAAGSFAVFASTTRTLSASVLAVTVVAYLSPGACGTRWAARGRRPRSSYSCRCCSSYRPRTCP